MHVTGSIGKNATVIIQDGSLIVEGNIEAHTDIKLVQESNLVVISSSSFFMNNVSIGGINTGKSVHVQGNVENGVTMSSQSADFNIDGTVGHHCKFKTHSGDIHAGNIGDGSTMNTMSGSVKVGNIGSNCIINTMSGGRIIANGRDITDLVNGASSAHDTQSQGPIRYTKSFK